MAKPELSKDPEMKELGFLQRRRLGNYRKRAGKSIIAVKTEAQSIDEITMHSLKLHPDDVGTEVDWSDWNRYFEVTLEELQKVSDLHAIEDGK